MWIQHGGQRANVVMGDFRSQGTHTQALRHYAFPVLSKRLFVVLRRTVLWMF